MRIYTEAFHHCTFVRIPAIQHGFATEALHIFVYDGPGPEATRLIPGIVRIWPKTYTVEVIFNGSAWDAYTHRFHEYVWPPQSGVVHIHGPLPSLTRQDASQLVLSPDDQKALGLFVESIGCDPWDVDIETFEAISLDGSFTYDQLGAIARFMKRLHRKVMRRHLKELGKGLALHRPVSSEDLCQ